MGDWDLDEWRAQEVRGRGGCAMSGGMRDGKGMPPFIDGNKMVVPCQMAAQKRPLAPPLHAAGKHAHAPRHGGEARHRCVILFL